MSATQLALARTKVKTIQQSVPANNVSVKRLTTVFSKNTISADRISLNIANGDGFMIGINQKNEVVALSKPDLAAPGVLIASYGEDLHSPNPCTFPSTSLGQGLVSVASLALASKVDVPTLSPTQQAPANTNASGSDKPPDNIGVDELDAVFVVIPMLCPIVGGGNLPIGINLADPLPDLSGLPDYAQLWFRAMKWLVDHNNSKSLHKFEKLFELIDVSLIENLKLDLRELAFQSYQTPSADSELRADYLATLSKFIDDVARNYLEPEAAPAAPGPTAASFDPAVLCKGIADGLAAAKISQDAAATSDKSLFLDISLKTYRIMFGRMVSQEDLETDRVHQVFVPAKLSEAFTKFIKASTNQLGVSMFQNEMNKIFRNRNPKLAHQRLRKLDIDHFKAAAIQAIWYADWAKRPIEMHPADATTKCSLLMFLPPAGSNAESKAFLAGEQQTEIQDRMEEDALKADKKRTSLFLNGQYLSFIDLDTCIANFAAFLEFAVDEYSVTNPPHIINVLEKVAEEFNSPNADDWYKNTPGVDKHSVPTGILSWMSILVQEVFTQASNPSLHDRLDAGKLTDPTIFNGCTDVLREFKVVLGMAIRQGSLGNFPTAAPFESLVKTLKPRATGKRSGDSSGKSESPKSKSKNSETKSTDTSSNKPDDADNKNKGLLVWSGTGRPTLPEFMWPTAKSNGVPVGFCERFLFRGQHCDRPNCGLNHYSRSKLMREDTDKKSMFCGWVSRTPNVDFAPGQEVVIG